MVAMATTRSGNGYWLVASDGIRIMELEVVIQIPKGSRNKYEGGPRLRRALARPHAVHGDHVPGRLRVLPARWARTATRSTRWCCSRSQPSRVATSRPADRCVLDVRREGARRQGAHRPSTDPRWAKIADIATCRRTCSMRSPTSSRSKRRWSPGREPRSAIGRGQSDAERAITEAQDRYRPTD